MLYAAGVPSKEQMKNSPHVGIVLFGGKEILASMLVLFHD